MRFHVLGLPHTVTSKNMLSCAYTQKVLKFCKMMSVRSQAQAGQKEFQTELDKENYYARHTTEHYIFHYGHEDSEVICDEHITVITRELWKQCYGDYDWKTEFYKHSADDLAHQTFGQNAVREIAKRIKKNDLVLLFWGTGHEFVYEALKKVCIMVEPGIGYPDTLADTYKVFESYAWLHQYVGKKNISMPDWYQVVIPNYFDPEDFDFVLTKKDPPFFLFLARMISTKGLSIAIELAKKHKFHLIVAGQGNFSEFLSTQDQKKYPNIQHHGFANEKERRYLLSHAKALLLPTLYVGPFEGTVIEAMMSGTPVITTDWGAFSEIVLHGMTGWRCRTFAEFEWAIQHVDELDGNICREWAIQNFSLSQVRKRYEHYFKHVYDVKEKQGWYQPISSQTNLYPLQFHYPSSLPYNNLRMLVENFLPCKIQKKEMDLIFSFLC